MDAVTLKYWALSLSQRKQLISGCIACMYVQYIPNNVRTYRQITTFYLA
jgi:hypothetical protein